MVSNDIVKSIAQELTICYLGRGMTVPSTIIAVAESLADAIDFRDTDQVHVIFRKAKDIESIPTQKTLKECWKNLHEEFIKYATDVANDNLIEYDDPRSAWLPKEDVKRKINLHTAIKNLCIAMGGDNYLQYCKAHATRIEERGDRKVPVWENRELKEAFDAPIREKLKELYKKYLRRLPMYEGYPEGSSLNLGLIPPTVGEFHWMLSMEAGNAR